jgi:hypothetical protein
MTVFDAIYGVSWATVFHESSNTGLIMGKLLPDQEENDLLGFLMKKLASPKFFTWCVL